MKASDVLGRKRLDELLAQGKSKNEIIALAKAELAPIKEAIGADVFSAFKKSGVPFDKIKKYADHARVENAKGWVKKDDLGNPIEEPPTTKDILEHKSGVNPKAFKDVGYLFSDEKLKDDYKKELKGESFVDRFKSGVTRVGAELGLLALSPIGDDNKAAWSRVLGPNVPAVEAKEHLKAISDARDEIGEEYASKHRDAAQQKEYEAATKAYNDAHGFVDTVKAGAGLLYNKAKNPSEWDMAGVAADFVNPINYVGLPAGKVAGALAKSKATKAIVGASAGAVGDSAVNAGYEYAVAKSKGASDEEAKKAAIVGGFAGAAMGSPIGAFGGFKSRAGRGIVDKVKNEWGDGGKVLHDVDKELKFDGVQKSTLNEDGKEPNNGALKNTDKNSPNLANLKNNLLLVVEKADNYSSQRAAKIEEISKSAATPEQRAKAIEELAPATNEEHYITAVLNDGQPISDRLAGFGNVEALQKSIASSTKSPEEIHAILHAEGFRGDNLDKMLESYIKKDATIYEDWAANKIKSHVGELENARIHTADRGTNGAEPKNTDSRYDSGTRETRGQNEQPQSVPELKERSEQAERNLGQIARELESKDGLSEKLEAVDGHAATRADEAAISGARENAVVQAKDGVRADKVETPTETYLKLKDEPYISPEVKAHLKALSDDYEAKSRAVQSVEPAGVKDSANTDIKTTKTKSTPENIDTDVKNLSDLKNHRYYDDLVESIKSEMVNKEPRMSAKELKAKLEKDGTWRDEDAYKAEFSKMFKKQGSDSGIAFNKYSKKEIAKIEAKDIDLPLARKLKADLQEYAANPIFEHNRKLIDEGLHAFADEVDILKQLKADEALHLVESKSFKDAFDEPISVSDAVADFDSVLKKLEGEDRKSSKVEADKNAMFGSDRVVQLSKADELRLVSIADPLERVNERRKMEYKQLTDNIAKARELGVEPIIKKTLDDFESWSKEHMEDGKIKKIGDC